MQEQLDLNFKNDASLWSSGKLSDQQMALHYFLYYYLKKNPSKKLEHYLLDGTYSYDILDKFQFKKVKRKAIEALIMWCKGEWSFQLSEKIYTPYEVLQIQSEGVRPVTMKFHKNLSPILHREDCFDFFLHDLEHGYMFNYDQGLRQMQIHFFKKVYQSLQTNLWDKYLNRDHFQERFHYLISDMNTHLEHYKAYLFSLIDREEWGQFEFLFDLNVYDQSSC